jgi:hypothetical protein
MKNCVTRCFMGSTVTEQDHSTANSTDCPTLDPWLKSSLAPFHNQNPSQIIKWGNASSDCKSSWLQHTHTLRTISWNISSRFMNLSATLVSTTKAPIHLSKYLAIFHSTHPPSTRGLISCDCLFDSLWFLCRAIYEHRWNFENVTSRR